MALAPRRPCRAPQCPHLQPCAKHPIVAWRPVIGTAPPRIRGRQLQQLRADLFRRQPWCAQCLKTGTYTKATIRDHVIPLAEGGRDDASNVQGLCGPCSDRKTQQESARGVRRR